MTIIHQKENLKFYIDSKFNIKYLSPVGKYVQWKLESDNWDDYNELYHSVNYFESLKIKKNIWFESHLLYKDDKLIGCLFIVGGEINHIENKYSIEHVESSLLLKYFHIAEKSKGYGTYWLNSVLFPYYKEKGYKDIYINSSHEISFPFYKRLGDLIATYEQSSDNHLFLRKGSCFKIKV